MSWRVGEHYGIHVYEGDRPVATFHNISEAGAAVAALNFVQDVAVNGLRVDLLPTMPFGDPGQLYAAMVKYLERADEDIRQRAANALDGA